MNPTFQQGPPGRPARAPAQTAKLNAVAMAPIRFSMIYLWGTFGLFLMGNLVREVENMFVLCLFLFSAYSCLYYGFRIGVISSNAPYRTKSIYSNGQSNFEKAVLLLGCIYFAVWGINQFYEFGGTDLVSIVEAIFSPGKAYKAKYDIFDMRLDTNRISVVTQVLVLMAIIYAIFIPLGIVSWKNMGVFLRSSFVISILLYILSFFFIGTMKGVGDVFLLIIAGGGVLLAKQTLTSQVVIDRRVIRLAAVGLGIAIAAYMAINQIDRAQQFGIREAGIVGDVSDTFIAKAFGDDVAYGLYSVLAYPSHGYLGLSYNLQQPFQFSNGAGFSQALESYRLQLLGGPDNRYLTYPFRTEGATGWPAGMYWATIFPWLASDLSFFGAPILMLALGFLFARVWLACIFGRSVLPLAALGQFVIFIAFIPANNQILMQRQGLWIVISLIILWALGQLHALLVQRKVSYA